MDSDTVLCSSSSSRPLCWGGRLALAALLVVVLPACDGSGVVNSPSDTESGEVVATFTVETDSPKAGTEVVFDASASEVPGGQGRYHWEFGDGSTREGPDAEVTHTYGSGGDYEAKLTVEGPQSKKASDTQIVGVRGQNEGGGDGPIAQLEITPSSPELGEQVTLDASESIPANGPIQEYEFRFENGFETTNQDGKLTIDVGDEAGSLDDGLGVTLVVSDISRTTDRRTRTIEIENPFASGRGTSGNPFRIRTGEQLQKINQVRDDLPGASYVLSGDINLSGGGSTSSLSKNGGGFPLPAFRGTLDGNGFEIRGLTVDRSSQRNLGLFEGIEPGGTVRNLSLTSVDIEGEENVGGLAGFNEGTISGVEVTGDVKAERDPAGGLVAINSGGTIEQSEADVTVEQGGVVTLKSNGEETSKNGHDGTPDLPVETPETPDVPDGFDPAEDELEGEFSVGGLVGLDSRGTIRASVARGDVTSTTDDVGGLVGRAIDTRIEDAEATGAVTGRNRVGGLVGNPSSTTITGSSASGDVEGDGIVGGFAGFIEEDVSVSNSRATGDADGDSGSIGGFVGLASGDLSITGSSAEGTVTGQAANLVGGFAGTAQLSAEIENSYAVGSVTGDTFVGGFVGGLASSSSRIETSYASGSVEADFLPGGFAGNTFFNPSVVNSYWDTQATGQSSTAGNATGLTTAQMQGTAAQANMGGFDFTNVWRTVPNDYPALRGLPGQN